jgi:hypothetical protein
MIITRFLVPVSALLLLAGCGVTECDFGSVGISGRKPGLPSIFTVADKGDIPSHFDFTSVEFASAVTGVWSDSEKSVTLTLTPSDPAEVQYSVGEKDIICITESTLEIIGEMDDTVEIFTMAGIFSSSESLKGANLEIGNETRSCWFEYTAQDDGTIMLHGSCLIQDPDGGDATSVELAFVKSGGV